MRIAVVVVKYVAAANFIGSGSTQHNRALDECLSARISVQPRPRSPRVVFAATRTASRVRAPARDPGSARENEPSHEYVVVDVKDS